MNDLRKAAEMALETLCVGANDAVPNDIDERFEQAIQALRQALAQPEQEPIAWMCEDPHHIGQCVTIYKTPPSIEAAVLAEREATPEQGNNSPNYPISESSTPFVDAVNMTPDRVDETVKGEHEPWPSVQCVCGGTIYFKYTPPVSDYHEGWEEGFKAAKRDSSSWVGLTTSEVIECQEASIYDTYINIEAKLKEKNGG